MPSVRPRNLESVGKQSISAFLLAVFLTLQVLAAVPFLHGLVHPDYKLPTHECGVTLLSHGQVDACDTVFGVALAATEVIAPAPLAENPLVSRAVPILPGRGPPLLS